VREPSELGPIGRVGAAVMIALVHLLFRIRTIGIERVPADGRAMLAANHVSALDGVVLGLVVWQRRRRVTRFLTGREFFRNPLFGAVLRAYRQIPLERGTGDAAALGEAISTVSGGGIGGIFPEGRVNANVEGPLQRGRTGVARIALAASAPVVPVGLAGTEDRWPRAGFRFARPFRPVVTLAFGPPVVLDGDAGSHDDAQLATEVVMDAIAEQVAVARAAGGRGRR
jgi:1-acyl-sn-glycerol-3-phosphate acyltransferase